MYSGKYSKRPKKRMSRLFILLASLVLLVNVSIFNTIAFLSTGTGKVENTFRPASVPNEVEENIENGVKTNVKIKNTGDTDAYIRAAVIITWADGDGNISGTLPVAEKDYSITWGDNGWEKRTDPDTNMTYYYYTAGPVAPGGVTPVLISECKLADGAAVPDGYMLSVEIMGQSIQADGTDSKGNPPVTINWPVTVNENGSLTLNK